MLTTLVSQVAEAYFELRALDLQLDISRRTLTSRQESLQLTQVREQRRRHVAGRRARGRAARVRRRRGHRGSSSAGSRSRRTSSASCSANFPAPITRGRELVDQPHAPDVPAGLPSVAPRAAARHPGGRAADRRRQRADRRRPCGVFPVHHTDRAAAASRAPRSARCSASGAGFWTAAVGASQPVFTAGRTRSQVALAEARTQEATILYAQTVKEAFREVVRRDRRLLESRASSVRSRRV